MSRMRRLFAATLTFTATLSLASCGTFNSEGSVGQTPAPPSQAAESQSAGWELSTALSVDPDDLDPQRTATASTFQITNDLYDTLLRVNTNGSLREELVQKWKVSEDGLTLTSHLRPDVRFYNDDICDAQAVIASFQRLKEEEGPCVADYANYTFSAQDTDTVVVTCEALDVTTLSNFTYPWSAVVDARVADTLKNQPVGTGPYRLQEWIPQQSLTLTKNPDYYDTVDLDTINFKMMPDATAQIAPLCNGELDIISASGDQVAAFEDDPQFNVVTAPSNGLQLMAMNLQNKALSDIWVRQAINYAVDRQALIDTIWWDYGQKISSHYPAILKEYVDINDRCPYDPEKAKELLSQAGYQDGLMLEMYLPKSYPAYVNAGQVIANSPEEMGITYNITIVEWATWLSDMYNGGNYDLTVVGHAGRLSPYVLLARYQSGSSESCFSYSNEEVGQLLANYKSETDEDKRTEIVQRVQEILAQDMPAYHIQDPIIIYITNNAVTGFQLYPIDIYELKDISLGQQEQGAGSAGYRARLL